MSKWRVVKFLSEYGHTGYKVQRKQCFIWCTKYITYDKDDAIKAAVEACKGDVVWRSW